MSNINDKLAYLYGQEIITVDDIQAHTGIMMEIYNAEDELQNELKLQHGNRNGTAMFYDIQNETQKKTMIEHMPFFIEQYKLSFKATQNAVTDEEHSVKEHSVNCVNFYCVELKLHTTLQKCFGPRVGDAMFDAMKLG